jgi:S1-C subfamily serine protease
LTALEDGQEGVPHFALHLGVLSASRRPIPGMGAALGITGKPVAKGLQITSIAEESPARAASMRENDILLEVAGRPARSIPEVNAIIQKLQPGDEVQIKFLRNAKEIRKQVRLASRSRVVANWEGDDYANGGISIRTDDFPEVLQHDMPLFPHDMGGPVFDLQGRAIAVNIARADRITTFALPMERFRNTLEKWLEADRHPPTAEKVKK